MHGLKTPNPGGATDEDTLDDPPPGMRANDPQNGFRVLPSIDVYQARPRAR